MSHLKISNGQGGLPDGTLHGPLDGNPENIGDAFGISSAAADIDGDGIRDLIVGDFPNFGIDPDGGHDFTHGKVRVLFLNADGSVRSFTSILETQFPVHFGFALSLAAPGDIDGDGVPDLVISAAEAVGGGAIIVVLMNPDGTVKGHRTIPSIDGGPILSDFGVSMAPLGDMDGDGLPDLAVGEPGRGKTWVLFLNADGSLRAAQRTVSSIGRGYAMTSLGDLDLDGVVDIAIDEVGYDSGRGAVWVLFLNRDGTVKAERRISLNEGGYTGPLPLRGDALCAPGDIDGDGITELVVSAHREPGNTERLTVLFLARDGTVRLHRRISASEGGFTGALDPVAGDAGDDFGSSLTAMGDIDGDGIPDLAVGARLDDDGADDCGAMWLLFLDGVATADFESGDDQERIALPNGRALSTPQAFTRSLTLASTGANAGPAIFDSTPLGPNDPSQDRDLIVGLGNLLILQNSQVSTQTVPGIFDRPNDDQDGGTVQITFKAPSEPLSLDLVDIDLGATQSVSVALIDAAGRRRLFSVPMGWTEDIATQGPPGYRTLDLTTLAPQAGFLSSATAVQEAGFAAKAVTHMEVSFGSSGALDNLRWDPHP